MTNFTTEKIAEITEALRAKIAAVPGASNVVASEPLLGSKDEVLDTICVQNSDEETEIKYIKIDYAGWRDSEEYGCEDNPVVFARFKIHSFQGYNEIRANGTTSANDIRNLDINLHNRFRETANYARRLAANCEHAPLALSKDIVLEADELTGAYGHTADYTIEVEIE